MTGRIDTDAIKQAAKVKGRKLVGAEVSNVDCPSPPQGKDK